MGGAPCSFLLLSHFGARSTSRGGLNELDLYEEAHLVGACLHKALILALGLEVDVNEGHLTREINGTGAQNDRLESTLTVLP